jgi:SAM-dependent methyltransferase
MFSSFFKKKSFACDKKSDAVDYFFLSHPLRVFASKISLHARRAMFDMFMDIMKPTPLTFIVDVGITPDTRLSESNFFENYYPYRHRIVATSIEDASHITKTSPGVQFVQTPGNVIPFCDNAFDIVFCSAVLEHVGNNQAQRNFIKELLRISNRFFITTPNRLFPFEFHTFLPLIHWFPKPYHQSLLRAVGMKFWAQTKNLNLLTTSSLTDLFPENIDVNIGYYHLMGIPSNIIAFGYSSKPKQDSES